ncbi:MAG: hypothetical protein HGA22_09675 [Clostridiales bacterium]|nr:hypothetical protein [Clostridiales bacterium]
MRRPFVTLLISIAAYVCILGPFTAFMKRKPLEEKLGFVPNTSMLRYVSADQKTFVSAALLMKVVMYFGGLTERPVEKALLSAPDYRGMSNIIHTALKLDPYNMDGYYFAQSFLTWDIKQFDLANRLLDYGMKYRTWDWYLPFFAGFNNAYFLKDYKKAAEYYKKAGELSGQDLHICLAGRYMQESEQTELAIAYLTAMEKGDRNPAVKKNYQIRLKAFREVRRIELARDRYRETVGRSPSTLEQLQREGFLAPPPVDPYGGRFFLEPDGKVTTTSKFAYAGVKRNNNQNSGEMNERH